MTEVGENNLKARFDGARNDARSRMAFAGVPTLEAANLTAHLPNKGKFWDIGKVHFSPASGAYRVLNEAVLALVEDQCPAL
eukprot:5924646-Prymnesium_polylepis.1